MNLFGRLKSESGFTIQELLVALVAGSLLVGFGFSLYPFVARIVERDIRAREHREHALRTLELIASDIEGSSSLTAWTDSTLEVQSPIGRNRFYAVRQGVLTRNGVTLGPNEGEQWLVEFRPAAAGRIAIRLKSLWGKDSTDARVELAIPMSSAVMFHAKDTTRGMSAFSKSIMH